MAGRDHITSDPLAAFEVFARHRNFTRAAEELHLSQPALHAKVQKLGRALGAALYTKEGRSLVLTEVGEALATFAQDQRKSADDFLSALDSPSPVLHLASGRGAVRWVLEPALQSMVRDGIQLRLTPADNTEAVQLVRSGSADVAALAFDPPPSDLRSRQVGEYPQTFVVPRSHRLADRASVQLQDLSGEPLILPPPGKPHRQALERAFHAAGGQLVIASEADGWDLIMHLATMGVGGAIVNGCVPTSGQVRSVVVSDLPAVGYWLAWRSQRQTSIDRLLDRI